MSNIKISFISIMNDIYTTLVLDNYLEYEDILSLRRTNRYFKELCDKIVYRNFRLERRHEKYKQIADRTVEERASIIYWIELATQNVTDSLTHSLCKSRPVYASLQDDYDGENSINISKLLYHWRDCLHILEISCCLPTSITRSLGIMRISSLSIHFTTEMVLSMDVHGLSDALNQMRSLQFLQMTGLGKSARFYKVQQDTSQEKTSLLIARLGNAFRTIPRLRLDCNNLKDASLDTLLGCEKIEEIYVEIIFLSQSSLETLRQFLHIQSIRGTLRTFHFRFWATDLEKDQVEILENILSTDCSFTIDYCAFYYYYSD